MLEFTYLLALLAAALLVLAILLGFRPGPGRLLQRLNGRITGAHDDIENGSRLLLGAVVVSGMAAILALWRWMFA